MDYISQKVAAYGQFVLVYLGIYETLPELCLSDWLVVGPPGAPPLQPRPTRHHRVHCHKVSTTPALLAQLSFSPSVYPYFRKGAPPVQRRYVHVPPGDHAHFRIIQCSCSYNPKKLWVCLSIFVHLVDNSCTMKTRLIGHMQLCSFNSLWSPPGDDTIHCNSIKWLLKTSYAYVYFQLG